MNVFGSFSLWEPTHIYAVRASGAMNMQICVWVFVSFSFFFFLFSFLRHYKKNLHVMLSFKKNLLTDASWLFSLFLAESEQQVEGYYRLRAVDYWERPGPYSEVTKYTDNLWNICALVTSPRTKTWKVEWEAQTGMCQWSTSIFENSCGCTTWTWSEGEWLGR